jgi:hypothetical protein
MQALSDDQHIAAVEAKVDKVEKKVDDGFLEMRAEFNVVRNEGREDRRELQGEISRLNRTNLAMWLTMVLGFAGIVVQQHL